ncbi:MAG: hypothetical protein SOY35_11850 [Blautia sp.]|uniref:hypothetical protein n=1 Tax=Blautia sp. TaxID=1955243 RepID=UPI002A83503A|nr:hypothetical protein [Blautia sp.]MDY4116555.1 hypothetical protein [Blautia sp.]
MKKRYLILAGLLVMTVAAAGCGKKQTTEETPVEATATPTPEVTKAVDMVDMQQTSDEDIKNVMGEKTSTASKIVFVNNTGDDIQSLYIRTHVDEDSEDYDADEDDVWGDDLINGMFTLTDKDKALYYMQTANTQATSTQTSGTDTSDTQTTSSNKMTASYDIRITYTDEDKNECFFRDIPLGTISQITLCMDGTDDDAIPYAKYLTGTSTKEVSTLAAVKKRLGLDDSSDSESDSTDSSNTDSTDNIDSTDNTDSTDNNNNSDSGNNGGTGGQDSNGNGGSDTDPDGDGNGGGNTDDPDDPGDGGDMISTAEQYIGQSLDALESACGSPQGSSYEDDPETGKTGFHYYSNFTVSTTVDENGNEIVAGIW